MSFKTGDIVFVLPSAKDRVAYFGPVYEALTVLEYDSTIVRFKETAYQASEQDVVHCTQLMKELF